MTLQVRIAQVKVGNRAYNKYLRKTVKPNRLKIYMDFNADMLRQSGDNEINLSTAARGGCEEFEGTSNIKCKLAYTSFPEFDGFMFDDPLKKITLDQEMIVDERVDEMEAFTPHPCGKQFARYVDSEFFNQNL